MTYEKAIEMLKDRKFGAAIRGHEETAEMCEIAIDALEKQEPKKPINDWSESPFSDDKGCLFLHTMCPNCKKVEVNKMDSFCFNCGQAIDWGESE